MADTTIPGIGTLAIPTVENNAENTAVNNYYSSLKDYSSPGTSSPTIVTDSNIRESTIPNIIAKTNSYTNPSITPNNQGTDSNQNNYENNRDYQNNYNGVLDSLNAQPIDPVIQQEINLIKSSSENQDAVTQASIQAINQQYNSRLSDMNQSQKSTTAGIEQSLNLGGSSRYAPVSSAGILSSKEAFDLKNLNDLQSTENSQIAQLRQAQQDKNYESMSKQLAILDKTRSDKIDMAKKIADNMTQTNIQNRKDVQAIALEVAKNGGDPNIIKGATNGIQAIEMAGNSLKQGTYDFQKTTDAFGNEVVTAINKNNPKERYVISNGSGDNSTPISSILTGSPSGKNDTINPNTGLSFAQYGLLANTDFNPKNQTDQLSQSYIDKYLKTGVVPTASTLGRGLKPSAFAQVDSRARDLYFKATGTPLPNPEVIKGYQNILQTNNSIANNLNTQEGTVNKNVEFSLENMKNNNLNSAGFKPLDSFLNTISDMFNDPHVGQLIAQNQTIQNELGSLLAVKNASGTTVYDKLSSAGIITSNDSPDQIKTKVSALLREASNFADSLNTANADIYKQIDPLMQDKNNPLRTSELRTSTQKLVDYSNNNPDKRNGILSALNTFKTQHGRDMTDSEIYKIFPEIEMSITSVKNK